MTQQRAVRTRTLLLNGAATEFARHGYTASSVNRIVENTACTKGSMYFHFKSKQILAEAVLDAAAAVYTTIADRWITALDVRPLDAVAGMVADAAEAFIAEPELRAETRLSLEPYLAGRHPTKVWEAAVVELTERAAELGCVREGFTAEKFGHVLTASLAGQRFLVHIVPSEVAATIRSGYAESLATVLAAARATNTDRHTAARPTDPAGPPVP